MADIDKSTGFGKLLKDAASYRPSDPELFARNMVRLVEESGKVLSAYLGPRERGEIKSFFPAEANDLVSTMMRVAVAWFATPARAAEAQAALWKNFVDLWAFSMRRMLGEAPPPVAEPDRRDQRFVDPDWTENQLFDFVKQAYLITAQWAERTVADAEGLDEHTRHKASFYVRQIINAVAPSNFVLTNPELLRETLSSNGENLVRGMQFLAEDIRAGHGDLKIRQTDPSKFQLGVNLATTPGKVVFQNELMQLIQYEPATQTVHARPLIIVPPWINKYYILDLTPEKSMVRWLVEQGHTVFIISWANPDERLASKSFHEYMRDGFFEAVDAVRAATKQDDVNAVGYCVGGTLLAVALGYMAATGDRRIASATLLTTQVDFTHAGDLKVFVDEPQLESLERRMRARGYLEGSKMATAFNLLRSNDLIWPYVIGNYLKGKEPFPFDLLYWNSDSTRMPAANHAFYLRHCYLQNDLSSGRMLIGNVRLDLKKVKIPIYNLATREDHIAPARSVFVGSRCFGGPVKFVLAGSGHIAGVVNPPKRQKYQHWVDGPAEGTLEEWIGRAEERPGSWWPDWNAWLGARNGPKKVKARRPGSGGLRIIEDAPGSYVKVRD